MRRYLCPRNAALRHRRGAAVSFRILPATRDDVGHVLGMIEALADYERLRHLCVATEAGLSDALFGPRPGAEVVLGWEDDRPVAFALFFHNFSTFLGRKGLYLEDLFVQPAYRGRGYGRTLLVYLARLAVERGCGRFEWAVLDWNTSAIGFYESLGATVLPDWRITRVTGPALDRLATLVPSPGAA
jgi:GNAT superfamily N-acetyltransferase